MTDERRPDDAIARWLADGPTRARDDLAVSISGRARRSSQRPGALARALGAPSGAAVPAFDGRAWVVLAAALLLVALAATALLIGGRRPPQPLPAVVVASPRASDTPAPTAAATFSPRATAGPAWAAPALTPEPRLVNVYENAGLGFRLALDGDYDRQGLMALLGDGADGTFLVSAGPCMADLCFPAALIGYGSLSEGAVVHRLYDTDGKVVDETRVSGANLAALETSWIRAVGESSFEDASVDGVPAVIATYRSRQSAMFVYHDRVWAISTVAGFLGGGSRPGAVREVMAAFSLIPVAPPSRIRP